MVELHNSARRILDDLINDFQVDNFTRFFREKNRSFAPRTEALSQYDDAHFRNGVKLGEIKFAQDEKMLICAFEANQPLSERSGKKTQYEKGKRILKEANADAGIFIFYSNSPLEKGGRGLSEDRGLSSFRFSLIYPEYIGTKRQWSYFKRFTYFVRPELTNKTFLQQIGEGDFSSLQKIKEAFSVDPVTKQFYNELQSWYFWAMDKIKFPADYKYSSDHAKDKEIRNATNLIRLITRIIFIWFLTEKGLVPPQVFSREKLRSIVKDFMNGKKASYFYNAILQNLFFGTLNQKMDERKFTQESGFQTNKKEYGIKNLFRYGDKFLIAKDEVLKLFKDIPFLNGGLFDCLDKEDEAGKVIYVDGFSRNPAKQSSIPDYLFFQQEEERVDLSQYGLGSNRTVRGLIEILNSYNFTIDENTLVDQEIALDPELLGKVFENLLASYNPETATTARKTTGSYYTPREIVDYMVQESLVAYLMTKLTPSPQSPPIKGGDVFKVPSPLVGEPSQNIPSPLAGEGKGEGNNESRLRQLLSYSEEIPEFSEPERQKIISAIDDIKILDPACGSGAFPMGILHKLVYALQKIDPENKYWHELQYQKAIKESEEVFKQGDKNEREDRLREINEAFDEGINYPDYARKLYLIENCIYGIDIQPIAIQISKLRFFISLVLDQKVDKAKENLGIRALPNLETKFVAANTLIGLDRPEQLAFKNPDIEKKEEELKQIRHKYFDTKTRKEKLDYQKKDAQIRKEIADLLKHSGWDTSTAEKIANFDIYDQNASADFFDPEWMFGIKNPSPLWGKHASSISSPLAGEGRGEEGFDVVIGNPPYVRADAGEEHLALRKRIIESKRYETLWEKWDLFIPFIELGYKVLRHNGITTMIVSDAYCHSKYAQQSQKWFLQNSRILRLDFLSKIKVFDAGVHNIVYFFQKAEGSSNKPERREHEDEFGKIKVLPTDEQKKLTYRAFFPQEERGNLTGTPLEEICYITYGLRPSSDEHEAKGEFVTADLVSEKRDGIHCKPYVEGKHLNNWYRGTHLWIEWGTERAPARFCRPTFPELYLVKEKLLAQRSPGPDPVACYDDEELAFTPASVGFILWHDLSGVRNNSLKKAARYKGEKPPRPDLPKREELEKTSRRFAVKYLLAVMNSSVASDFLRSNRRSNIHLYPDDWKHLPIPDVPMEKQTPLVNLVDQILAAKRNNPLSPLTKGELPNADLPERVRSQSGTSALEHQIDEMVYELYGLTDEEIKIVEGIK